MTQLHDESWKRGCATFRNFRSLYNAQPMPGRGSLSLQNQRKQSPSPNLNINNSPPETCKDADANPIQRPSGHHDAAKPHDLLQLCCPVREAGLISRLIRVSAGTGDASCHMLLPKPRAHHHQTSTTITNHTLNRWLPTSSSSSTS